MPTISFFRHLRLQLQGMTDACIVSDRENAVWPKLVNSSSSSESEYSDQPGDQRCSGRCSLYVRGVHLVLACLQTVRSSSITGADPAPQMPSDHS